MVKLASVFILILSLLGCAGGRGGSSSGSVLGNDNGSEPVNNKEVVDYQKAVARCHKTGGTRIVKIEGNLQCF